MEFAKGNMPPGLTWSDGELSGLISGPVQWTTLDVSWARVQTYNGVYTIARGDMVLVLPDGEPLGIPAEQASTLLATGGTESTPARGRRSKDST